MARAWKVVVPDRLRPPADVEQEVFGEKARIFVLQAKCAQDIVSQLKDADGILAWHELKYTDEILSKMLRCKGIVRVGAGFDNVDIVAAAKRNIIVSNVPDYGVNDVADHACSLVLSIYRNLSKFILQSKASEGWCWENAGTKRLTDQTVGIIGLGRIGTAFALRMKAFRTRVIFYDPYLARGVEKSLGLERKDFLEDLLEEADIISFHTPLTAETMNMADVHFFRKVKKGAVLINTARGAIINLDALHDALRFNKVWAAGLDVLDKEPPDEKSKLIHAWQADEPWQKNRLLITPHCAFYSPQAFQEMRRKAAQELKRILEKKKPFSCVNSYLF